MSDKRPVPLSFIRARLVGSMRFPHSIWLTILAACLTLLTTRTANPQQASSTAAHMPILRPWDGGIDDRADTDPAYTARRLRALNDKRQKEIVSDTGKLLKLASELDAEIHQANSESLTPDQLRRLAAIEKLAHNVKEHMSTPVIGLPIDQQPTVPITH